MPDIAKIVRDMLAQKSQEAPRLTYDDVADLIIMVIKDAHFSEEEQYDFQQISQFAENQMTQEAQSLFRDFFDGFTGKRQPKEKEIDILEFIKERYGKQGGGRMSKLDRDDIKRVIIHVIKDGKISEFEFEKFKEAQIFQIYNMTEDAKQLYKGFLQGLERKFGGRSDVQQQLEEATSESSFMEEIMGDIPQEDLQQLTGDLCPTCKGERRISHRPCNGTGSISRSEMMEDKHGNLVYESYQEACECGDGYIGCPECQG